MCEEQYQQGDLSILNPFLNQMQHTPEYFLTCKPFSRGVQIIHKTVLKHSAAQIRLANMAVNER